MKKSWTESNRDEPDKESGSLNIFGALQALKLSSAPIFKQLTLHRQLLNIEWEEEKKRLASMFALTLIGFASFICLLIFIGVLALALSWNTEYVIFVAALLCVVYGVIAYIAWWQIMVLANRPYRCFSDTRKELTADIALIASKLS